MTPSPRPPRAAAMTLIEVLVAAGLVALLLLSLLAATAGNSRVRIVTRQREHLNRQVHDYATELRSQRTVAEVLNLIATAPNWVALGPQPDYTSQDAVSVPNGMIVTASSVSAMTEAEASAAFGLSFDFDRDGTRDSATSNPNDYRNVVPVSFSVTWVNGTDPDAVPITTTFPTIIYPRGS